MIYMIYMIYMIIPLHCVAAVRLHAMPCLSAFGALLPRVGCAVTV